MELRGYWDDPCITNSQKGSFHKDSCEINRMILTACIKSCTHIVTC